MPSFENIVSRISFFSIIVVPIGLVILSAGDCLKFQHLTRSDRSKSILSDLLFDGGDSNSLFEALPMAASILLVVLGADIAISPPIRKNLGI